MKALSLNRGVGALLTKLLGRASPGVGWTMIAVDSLQALSASTRDEVDRRAAEHERWHRATIEGFEAELDWATNQVRSTLARAHAQVEREVRDYHRTARAALDHADALLVSLDEAGADIGRAVADLDRVLVEELLRHSGRPRVVDQVQRQPGRALTVTFGDCDSDTDGDDGALAVLRHHFISETVSASTSPIGAQE